MNKLSTGQNSTLGEYLKLTTAFFGNDSNAARFIRDKINEDPQGSDAEVIADESQMLNLLMSMDA